MKHYRLLAAFVLLSWMAPSFGAMGVGLHVILDHHDTSRHDAGRHDAGRHNAGHHKSSHHKSGHHNTDHLGSSHHSEEAQSHHGSEPDNQSTDWDILAAVLAHGHHHDAEVGSDHEHQATTDGSATILRPGAKLLPNLPLLLSAEAFSAPNPRLVDSARHGPPNPLFTTNCSLLL